MSGERHLGEEDLVLLHYGEALPDGERHLEACPGCRGALEALRRDLAGVPAEEPPPRGPDYGARVWARLQPRLEAESRAAVNRPVSVPRARRRVWAPLAMAASLVLAFLLGRHWPRDPLPEAVPAAARERILLLAVGDHLERSQMLLVELVNAGGDGQDVDISSQQRWAEELIGANRLYRQTVARSGESGVTSLLEELERLLVEVAHRPSSLSAGELSAIRARIEGRGLLFRVRVIETQVRDKQKETTVEPAPAGRVVS